DRRVRQAQAFSQYNACLGETHVVGLQTGQDQVEALFAHGLRKSSGHTKGIRTAEAVVFDVDRPIGAAGKSFTNDLRDPRWTSRADDDFAAVFLFEPQRLFERVGVGLVHLVGRVGLTNPGLGFVKAWLAIPRRVLLDA